MYINSTFFQEDLIVEELKPVKTASIMPLENGADFDEEEGSEYEDESEWEYETDEEEEEVIIREKYEMRTVEDIIPEIRVEAKGARCPQLKASISGQNATFFGLESDIKNKDNPLVYNIFHNGLSARKSMCISGLTKSNTFQAFGR
jgi:hypothetical protein